MSKFKKLTSAACLPEEGGEGKGVGFGGWRNHKKKKKKKRQQQTHAHTEKRAHQNITHQDYTLKPLSSIALSQPTPNE